MSAHPDKCKTISKLVYFCKSTNEILGKKNHLFRLKNRNSMLTHHVTIDYYAHLADREWRTYIYSGHNRMKKGGNRMAYK